MNAASHPDVPRALDEGVTPDGRPFFVMDWVDGETLADHADRFGGRLPVRDVEHIGLHLAAILSAVHEAGVLHLDVKRAGQPANTQNPAEFAFVLLQ